MAGANDKRDAESITTSSISDGIVTPNTEAFGDHPTVHEWLASSATMTLCPCTGSVVLADCPCSTSDRRCGAHAAADAFGPLKVTRDAEPMAGDTFLIIDKYTNRALTCHGGYLRLVDGTDATKHWQWLCTTKDGFFGFQNVAEGGFLGHDIWWNFYAKVYHHEGWECFKTDKRPGGGYWIQALHWWEFWQVSARGDNSGLHAEKWDGTLWEFVKIHN